MSYTNKSLNTVIKELAILALEQLASETGVEFVDRDGNHYKIWSLSFGVILLLVAICLILVTRKRTLFKTTKMA